MFLHYLFIWVYSLLQTSLVYPYKDTWKICIFIDVCYRHNPLSQRAEFNSNKLQISEMDISGIQIFVVPITPPTKTNHRWIQPQSMMEKEAG